MNEPIDIREYEGDIVVLGREFTRGVAEHFTEPSGLDAYEVLVDGRILTALNSRGDACFNTWFRHDGEWESDGAGSATITTPDGTPLIVKEAK